MFTTSIFWLPVIVGLFIGGETNAEFGRGFYKSFCEDTLGGEYIWEPGFTIDMDVCPTGRWIGSGVIRPRTAAVFRPWDTVQPDLRLNPNYIHRESYPVATVFRPWEFSTSTPEAPRAALAAR